MPAEFREEDLAPEAGWTRFPQPAMLMRANFVFGHAGDDNRLRVRYYRPEGDSPLGVVGKAWFGAHAEGPPGHAHGGSMAALLDDLMGTCAWVAGHMVVAANIRIDFRRPLPLGSVVRLEARVEKADGKKIHTRGRILDPDGAPFSEGQGLFIAIGPERFRQFSAPMA